MKTKLKIFIVSGFATVFLANFVFITCQNKKLEKENTRLANNQRALLKSVESFRLKDSTQVTQIEILSISKDELEELCSEQTDEISALKLKLSRVKNYSQVSQQAEYVIHDTVYDSVYNTDTLKCINFNNPYISLSGCMTNSQFNGTIQTFDTTVTIVHKEYRKRFLWFKWKPYYKVTIHNKNPYSSLTNQNYIEVK